MPQEEVDSLVLLSKKMDHLFFGIKLMSFLFLLLASFGAFFGALEIPHFQEIFMDALPGKPLPAMTLAIIWAQKFLVVTPILFALVGVLALFLRNIKLSISLLAAALCLAIIQTWGVTFALNLPMQGLLTGMADGGK
jgi:hypothetical protein